MAFIDWHIIAFPLLIVLALGLSSSQQYFKSDPTFISGGRAAGRYLLNIAGDRATALMNRECAEHNGLL